MWRPWSLQQINACFPAHPHKIKAHSRSAWTLPLIPKCEMEFKRNFLKNFGALTGFLLWFSSRLEQIGACLRSFVCGGWVFNQRWSMEAKRMQVFLSLCKLDLQSALRPVSSASLCLEKARKASALGGGGQHITISRHTGRPLKYSTYTSSIDCESRWAPRCSSDERQAFENRRESVYSCLEEKGLHINVSRGHQFIYLSC